MTLNIILDVVVAGLLVATIAYAALLSRRLGALRNDKQQLEALVSSLDTSSQRAEGSIAALRETAERIGQQLQQRIDQGKALQGDLSDIIDLGGGLADRMEATIRTRRDDGRAAPAAEPEAAPRRRAAGERPLDVLRARPNGDEAVPAVAADAARIADFPSRAERLLRGALEARR
jgi:chromosome segregation ATPase